MSYLPYHYLYHTRCPVCNGTGNIQFKQGEATYPNAPCCLCRYEALKRWLEHWGLNRYIAPYLWKHHAKNMPKCARQRNRQYRQLLREKKKVEEDPSPFLPKPPKLDEEIKSVGGL